MPGCPQAGIPLGIPETAQRQSVPGRIVFEERSHDREKTRPVRTRYNVLRLMENVVGFTNRRRVAEKRRGVVVGKMTLIYEKDMSTTQRNPTMPMAPAADTCRPQYKCVF
jgi:hypothetical protein